jgi:hypothetical protein
MTAKPQPDSNILTVGIEVAEVLCHRSLHLHHYLPQRSSSESDGKHQMRRAQYRQNDSPWAFQQNPITQARRIVAYRQSKFVRSLSYLPLESLCRLNESRPLRGTQDATRNWRVK